MEKNSHDPLKEPTQTPSAEAVSASETKAQALATVDAESYNKAEGTQKSSDTPPQKANPQNPWDKASKITLIIIAALAFLASVFGICNHYSIMTDVIDMALACSISRWLACAALVFLGVKRQDLTTWIVIAMFLGIEIGYSFHDTGLKLGILSKIFLKLVKTIVA